MLPLISDCPLPAPVTIDATPEAQGRRLAVEILEAMQAARRHGKPYLLGSPCGRSPRFIFQALGELAGQGNADLAHVHLVMMDEYVFPASGGYAYCAADAHYSCHRFVQQEILDILHAGVPAAARIPASQVWFPDPLDPAAYDTRIAAAGGVDLFIIASGASDGHVAFNPPGSALDSPSRIITIHEPTRRDNLGTFPAFTSLDEVPRYGVSVGLGTIAALARKVVLVIDGAHKRQAVAELLSRKDFDPAWPASMIYRCRQGSIALTQSAVAPEEM